MREDALDVDLLDPLEDGSSSIPESVLPELIIPLALGSGDLAQRIEQFAGAKRYFVPAQPLQSAAEALQKAGIDAEFGGFLWNTDRDGTRLGTSKTPTNEGRGIWVWSYLYNVISKDQKYLDTAKRSVDLILKSRPEGDRLWPSRLTREGEPDAPADTTIYGDLDEPDLQAIRQVGLPFWLAGGYGSREKLQQALACGAAGVQVGSVFALAEESGMKSAYRTAILKEIKKGTEDAALVKTTLFSPTGFPFKVVQLRDTVADEAVFAARPRVCDLGILQQRGLSLPAADGIRCDDHSLNDSMWIAFQHMAVHECTWVAFVCVADNILGVAFCLTTQFPLSTGWEPGASATTQIGFLDICNDLVWGHLKERFLQRFVSTYRQIVLNFARINQATIL